jgi:Mn-containing catalase
MFFHRKQLMLDVKVEDPQAQFGQLLLEQFGGATGELTAALTYWTQSFHVEDRAIRDMLQDIAIEEFSHLEMVGRMIEQHTEKGDKDKAYKSTLFAVRGIGPHLVDSQGQAWTSAYVNEGGNVVRDLRADIAAEAGARHGEAGTIAATCGASFKDKCKSLTAPAAEGEAAEGWECPDMALAIRKAAFRVDRKARRAVPERSS